MSSPVQSSAVTNLNRERKTVQDMDEIELSQPEYRADEEDFQVQQEEEFSEGSSVISNIEFSPVVTEVDEEEYLEKASLPDMFGPSEEGDDLQ